MTKKTVLDVDWPAKTRVIIRVDFNVPLTPLGEVRDDFRIRQAIPTLQYLLDRQCSLVLLSHLGRPKGKFEPSLSLAPVVYRLRELLPGHRVDFCRDWVGDDARAASRRLRPGQILLLENIRFCPQEATNDLDFAKNLSRWGRVLVNDCFGAAQRRTVSTVGLATHLPAVAGMLMASELEQLQRFVSAPGPLGVILGGAKIDDKLQLVADFADRAEFIAPVGLLAVQFLAALGWDVGGSRVDSAAVDKAREIIDYLDGRPEVELFVPSDYMVGSQTDPGLSRPLSFSGGSLGSLAPDSPAIEASEFIADIGPAAAGYIAGRIRSLAKVIWNGSAGIVETPNPAGGEAPFSHGSRLIAKALATPGAPITVVGGGDTLSFLDQQQPDLKPQFDWLSTGGGASLTYLAGQPLPAVEVLWPKSKSLILKTSKETA